MSISNNSLPQYVRLGCPANGTTVVRCGNTNIYYRHAGDWTVELVRNDFGSLEARSKFPNWVNPMPDGTLAFLTTYEVWHEQNRNYLFGQYERNYQGWARLGELNQEVHKERELDDVCY